MRYDIDSELIEIERLAAKRVKRQERRALHHLAEGIVVALAALVGALAALARNPTSATPSQYGAFMLPTEMGGYVLTALCAFALGVVVTTVCVRQREQQNGKQKRQ